MLPHAREENATAESAVRAAYASCQPWARRVWLWPGKAARWREPEGRARFRTRRQSRRDESRWRLARSGCGRYGVSSRDHPVFRPALFLRSDGHLRRRHQTIRPTLHRTERLRRFDLTPRVFALLRLR